MHNSVNNTMWRVLFALLPGILLSIYYFGLGVFYQCAISIIFAFTLEMCIFLLQKRKLSYAFKDSSTIILAVLFALTLSPYTPWWVNFIGVFFAVVIVKYLYGGLGNNLFNPAMGGYAFVLLCFPAQIVFWPDITLVNSTLTPLQQLDIIFSGNFTLIDGFSGATPLGNLKLELDQMNMVPEIISNNSLYGSIGGKAWEMIGLAYILGGAWLLFNKTIRWQIPFSVLIGFSTISFLFNVTEPDVYPSVLFSLFSGGILLCAFFIATDPVSSSSTNKGKIIYGVGIGVLTYIIRIWGSYPEGVAFAVLIMNSLVPFIDYYTKPKISGET